MKKALRLVSIVLCLVMVVSTFYGCTMTINVDLSREGEAVQVGQPETQASTVATQAPATTAPTTATPAATDSTAAPAASDAPSAAPASSEAPSETPAPANAIPTTKEEIVAEYIKVYNTTKATGTFLGKESMNCESVAIDGNVNGTITKLAGTFMTADGTDMQLPPYSDSNPAKECLITADDIDSAEYTDNGDGTATIKLVPKEVKEARKFSDPQGKMFNVMEDVSSTLASVPVLTWSEGDANSNVVLTEKESTATVTFNKDTKMMTAAEYVLITYADVTHANVLMFKDKSATAKFVYTESFPQG
ncbi:MAG: hypothetical protein NC122_00950 [Faecalibacterium sp.]|nr:hypothetical protein [Ruminococcus sp.]MCM1391270.1 hypothetical protein [Ruminococcus sp.]MCM1484756.1 hypothetical protein [Faecalibacterium sp.]